MTANNICLIILVTLLFGCSAYTENNKKKFLLDLPDLNISESLTPYNEGAKKFRYKESQPTLIILVGAGCNICIPEMNSWNELINKGKVSKEWNYRFIAVGNPNFYFDENVLRRDYLKSLPIFLDKDSIFVKRNNLRPWNFYKTILIDREGNLFRINSPIDDINTLEMLNDF